MNNVVYMLAAEGGENPGSGSFSVLLPKNYDIFWSLLCFIVILLLFWKLVLPKYTKMLQELSLIHISEPTRLIIRSRMPSSA